MCQLGPLACFSAIALGTMSGGWKIVKTMGTRITKVTPLEGVAAETAGAVTLFLSEHLGIPVSTTHTITGSIIGVGATNAFRQCAGALPSICYGMGTHYTGKRPAGRTGLLYHAFF